MKKNTDTLNTFLTRKFAGDDVHTLVEWLENLDVGDWSMVSFRLTDDSHHAFFFLYNERNLSCILAECEVVEVIDYGDVQFIDTHEIHYVHSLSLTANSDLRKMILDALCEIHSREIECDG